MTGWRLSVALIACAEGSVYIKPNYASAIPARRRGDRGRHRAGRERAASCQSASICPHFRANEQHVRLRSRPAGDSKVNVGQAGFPPGHHGEIHGAGSIASSWRWFDPSIGTRSISARTREYGVVIEDPSMVAEIRDCFSGGLGAAQLQPIGGPSTLVVEQLSKLAPSWMSAFLDGAERQSLDIQHPKFVGRCDHSTASSQAQSARGSMSPAVRRRGHGIRRG